MNCIIWGNAEHEICDDGDIDVSYSNIEGGWPGTMNIDSDPLFIDPLLTASLCRR